MIPNFKITTARNFNVLFLFSKKNPIAVMKISLIMDNLIANKILKVIY